MNSYRKLLVLATNYLLDTRLISLDAAGKEEGMAFAKLAGESSAINWIHISHGELRISVWWKYDQVLHPQVSPEGNQRERFQSELPLANKIDYPKFLGVAASGWLERRMGKFLQGWGERGIVCTYCRLGELEAMNALPVPMPAGYAAEGKFFE